MATREQIVAEAKSWERTPYRDGTGIKGVGADCAYLALRVFQNVGLISPDVQDPDWYSPQEWMHKESTTYINFIEKYCPVKEVGESEVGPGDFVLYRVPRGPDGSWTHGGIVVKWPEYVIHPTHQIGVHGSHGKQGWLGHRAYRFFTLVKEEK